MSEYFNIDDLITSQDQGVMIQFTKRITLYNAYWQHYFSDVRKLFEFISQIVSPLGYKTLFKLEKKYIIVDFIKEVKEN